MSPRAFYWMNTSILKDMYLAVCEYELRKILALPVIGWCNPDTYDPICGCVIMGALADKMYVRVYHKESQQSLSFVSMVVAKRNLLEKIKDSTKKDLAGRIKA